MSKTIISIVIMIAIIIVGWLFLSSNKNRTAANDNQQKVFENILAGDKVKTMTTQEGSGAEAKIDDKITIRYTAKVENGKVFDSSNEPLTVMLGQGNILQGWELGMLGMKSGEKRTITIAPEFGYGTAGRTDVPPNSTLVFDVELLSIGQ